VLKNQGKEGGVHPKKKKIQKGVPKHGAPRINEKRIGGTWYSKGRGGKKTRTELSILSLCGIIPQEEKRRDD